MTALIGCENLSLHRGGRRVLDGINLQIAPGEIVTIVGPNGSGKTSLLRALIGADPAETGRVVRKSDLRMGYVPQRLIIPQSMPLDVMGFLQLAGRITQARIDEVAAECDITPFLQTPMQGLSGGQFQRVLLARAILHHPQILVLDEPTQALDQTGASAFYRRIEALRANTGCSVLMVSHDLHVVMSASDRVICLNGHICCEGHPDAVANAPEYRALFGTGTGGALALYRHKHDYSHDHTADHAGCDHD